MTQLLYKFSLQAAKYNANIFLCVLLIWLVVLGCTFQSILSQPFTPRQRIFWIAAVTLLPIIGLLAYLPFSFRKEDLPQLFLAKRDHRKQSDGTTATPGERT